MFSRTSLETWNGVSPACTAILPHGHSTTAAYCVMPLYHNMVNTVSSNELRLMTPTPTKTAESSQTTEYYEYYRDTLLLSGLPSYGTIQSPSSSGGTKGSVVPLSLFHLLYHTSMQPSSHVRAALLSHYNLY